MEQNKKEQNASAETQAGVGHHALIAVEQI